MRCARALSVNADFLSAFAPGFVDPRLVQRGSHPALPGVFSRCPSVSIESFSPVGLFSWCWVAVQSPLLKTRLSTSTVVRMREVDLSAACRSKVPHGSSGVALTKSTPARGVAAGRLAGRGIGAGLRPSCARTVRLKVPADGGRTIRPPTGPWRFRRARSELVNGITLLRSSDLAARRGSRCILTVNSSSRTDPAPTVRPAPIRCLAPFMEELHFEDASTSFGFPQSLDTQARSLLRPGFRWMLLLGRFGISMRELVARQSTQYRVVS